MCPEGLTVPDPTVEPVMLLLLQTWRIQKGLDCECDKRNTSVVICGIDIPSWLTKSNKNNLLSYDLRPSRNRRSGFVLEELSFHNLS